MQKLRFFLLTKSLGLYINTLSHLWPSRSRELSYRLFSSPRYGKLKPANLPEVLKKASPGALMLHGQRLQSYTWQGSAETILLVHGWESNASRWEKLLPHLLSTGKTVVAIDAPAHGLSEGDFNIPKYSEAIDKAVREFKPRYLIGHSIGGAAIVYYQHLYQNHGIEKVVLLGSPSDFDTITDNYVSLLSLSDRSRKLFESYFTENFNYHPKDFTARLFARSMQMPGIIAHDEEDDVVFFAESGKIAQAWTTARFIQTKGLGHSMHDDGLYSEVAAFLTED